MGPYHDHLTISLPLEKRLVAIWTEDGKSLPQPHPFKAAWAILLARISGTNTTKFAVLQQPAVSPSEACYKSASWVPRVETWAISESPDSNLVDAAKEQHKECLPGVKATTGMIIGWDDEATDGSISLPCGFHMVIVLNCRISPAQVYMRYSTRFVPVNRAWAQLAALVRILELTILSPNLPLKELDFLGCYGRKLISQWNDPYSILRPYVCIQTLILEHCHGKPDAEALCAWDGSMTYAELDELSLAIAADLRFLGVQPESIVPLCFEKSRWTPVAILGVLRAGGAFVLLDSSYPVARLVEICSEVQAKVVLTSHSLHELGSQVCPQAVRVPRTKINMDTRVRSLISCVKPSNAAYIAFTSGSTGKPKGIVIEHQSFCANALAQNAIQNLNQQTRAFQFASHGFDSSILEMLMTLIAGGCVCIPSDEQRLNGLTNAICDLRANWLELTPSVARFIDPEQVTGVKSVLLVGEPMSQEHVRQWSGRVQLLNAYGPAECSVVTTVQRHARLDDPQNIGRSYSSHCWLVNPCDHNQLEPLGAVGELLISGPIVAPGYLNHPHQTSFITTPSWATQFGVPADERFYKTGDLAQYNVEDGTLRYVGRKDREIKVHGQRVDLQEIEYHASQFQGGISAVVDIIQVTDSSAGKLLTLFIVASDADGIPGGADSHVVPANSAMLAISTAVKCWLQDRLPPFMVPTKYIWVDRFPLTRTGKLDRRALVALAAESNLSLPRFAEEDLPTKNNKTALGLSPDLKAKEDLLRSGFAEVLGCREQDIGTHDGFYELGGNSLAAIELVARVHSRGLQVAVADVISFQNAHEIARFSVEAKETQDITSFSLLLDPDKTLSLAIVQCQMEESLIEDIYPCTPQQEGLMYLSTKTPGAFMGTYRFSLAPSTSLVQMQAAWDQLWRAHPILRTRIVLTEDGKMMQVVIKENLISKDGCPAGDDQPMGLGSSLARLKTGPGLSSTDSVQFILTIHHAIFDAWSYMLLLEDLHRFYNGDAPPPRPAFTQVIKYISTLDMEKCRSFWSQEFNDLQAHVFPSSSRPSATSPRWLVRSQQIRLATPSIDWKLPNQIKLAWALVVSSQTNSDDVVYGLTISGRNAPVPNIDRIAGPTFTTFPFRTQLKPELSVEQMLVEFQQHDVAIMLFEHTGLRCIAEASSDAALACSFQNLLTIRLQSVQSPSATLIDLTDNENQDIKFASYPLSIVAQQQGDLLETKAIFDGTILNPCRVQTLLGHFDSLLQQVLQHPGSRIRDLKSLLSSQWQQFVEINTQTHVHPECIYDVIQTFSTTQPNSEAVCAWDGSLTYDELIALGRRLAGHLQSLGPGPGVVIGICMERSKWFPVAIVGVMMSGAAMVLLEPNFPADRLDRILEDSGAQIVICSPALRDKFEDKTENIMRMIFLAHDMVNWADFDSWIPPSVVPSDPMYIAYTSGSTGAPKGVVIEHGMVYSTLCAHRDIIGASPASRGLLFASPAFDICVAEVIFMLGTGGCLCIPSETQRTSSLADTMTTMQVNMAMLTPSVARTISPEIVPTLQTLILGGESPSASDLATWALRVQLHQSYGPAECTMYTATTERLTPRSDLTNVGSSPNASYWIVNPENHDELRPVGSMGELLIGGPLVGRGYINRPQESEAAFIHDPAWSQHFPFLKGYRLYKTGDLAILNTDKSLILVGRKDTQVKLHGQRIELHEIERYAEGYQRGTAVIAELVELQNTERSSLVMFAYNPMTVDTTVGITPGAHGHQKIFLPPATGNLSYLKGVRKYLNQHLPTYMVPSLILELSRLPLSPGGKVDRKILKQAASMLERETLKMYLDGFVTTKTQPVTDQERAIRAIFAMALSLDEESVGVDDSFFALGGDSISAMRVLMLCRKRNMTIPMPEFLSHNTVSLLCTYVNMIPDQSQAPVFQKSGIEQDQVEGEDAVMRLGDLAPDLEIVRSRLNLVNSHSIENIYPCSDSHSGVLEFYSLNYTSTAIFQILPTGAVSAMQVSNAWNQLVQRHTALRTILMDDPGVPARYLQVVLKLGTAQDLVLPSGENAFSDLMKLEPVQSWDLSPLHRLVISQDQSGAVCMRLETGGALIDAFSVSVLLRELSLLLRGQSLSKIGVTYRHYLTHLCHQSRAKTLQYWTQVLHGAHSSYLPRIPSKQTLQTMPSASEPRSRRRRLSTAQFKCFSAFWRSKHFTVTNLFQLAWALTLAHYTNSRNVCFGITTSGRDNPELEIHDTVGSFFNVLPCRFAINPNCTVLDTLRQNQEESQRRSDHQNCSMPEMVRKSGIRALGNDHPLFNTVMTVQNDVSVSSSGEDHRGNELEIKLLYLEDATEYDFCIVIFSSPSHIEIELRHWTSTASDEYASDILHRLFGHLDLIVRNPTKPLSEITSMNLGIGIDCKSLCWY